MYFYYEINNQYHDAFVAKSPISEFVLFSLVLFDSVCIHTIV